MALPRFTPLDSPLFTGRLWRPRSVGTSQASTACRAASMHGRGCQGARPSAMAYTATPKANTIPWDPWPLKHMPRPFPPLARSSACPHSLDRSLVHSVQCHLNA